MRKIHIRLIQVECIKFSAENGLKIQLLDDATFIASSNELMIHIPIEFLYTMIQQGWEIQEVLANEVCFLEAV